MGVVGPGEGVRSEEEWRKRALCLGERLGSVTKIPKSLRNAESLYPVVFLRDGVRNEMCPAPKPELVRGGRDPVRGGKTPQEGQGEQSRAPSPSPSARQRAESLAPLDLLPVSETGALAVASKAPLRPGHISRLSHLSPPGRGQVLQPRCIYSPSCTQKVALKS